MNTLVIPRRLFVWLRYLGRGNGYWLRTARDIADQSRTSGWAINRLKATGFTVADEPEEFNGRPCVRIITPRGAGYLLYLNNR